MLNVNNAWSYNKTLVVGQNKMSFVVRARFIKMGEKNRRNI